MGAVAVLGGIWEIVFCGASCAGQQSSPVARGDEPGDAGLHGGNREAYGTVALGRAFNRSLARRPCGHEMITRVGHIGEPCSGNPGHVFHHG
jgi:hypothetical protein